MFENTSSCYEASHADSGYIYLLIYIVHAGNFSRPEFNSILTCVKPIVKGAHQ